MPKIIAPGLSCSSVLGKMLIGEFSCRSFSVSEGRITAAHWPAKTSEGQCKRCLKLNKVLQNGMHGLWKTHLLGVTTQKPICKSGAKFKIS